MESIFDQVSKKHLELQHLLDVECDSMKTPCEVVFKFRKLFEHLNNTTHLLNTLKLLENYATE